MASTTIGISPATKRALSAAKPPAMPWDAFMVTLLEVADTDRFLSTMESQQDESEQAAAEKAKQRYMKYRRDPDALITGTELRRRVHVRRLLESLAQFHGGLRLAAANPTKGDEKALRALLDDLDEQIHGARQLLQAA